MTDQTLIKVRELLLNEFSEPELVALCKDIGLDYAVLPGTGTFGKTREIIEATRAQDKLRLLQSRLRELKPEAYAAAGINALAAPADAPDEGSAPSKRGKSSDSPIPRVVLPLLLLLFMVIGASLVLPRLTGEAAFPATPQAATEGAVAATTQSTPALQAVAPDVQSTIALLDATLEPTPTTDVVASAMTPVLEPTSLPSPTPPTEEPSPPGQADQLTTPAAGTLTADEAHPAAMNVRQMNNQLVLFYTGQASAEDLASFWMGEALRAVVDFGNTRLPRAMRIASTQRAALEIAHEYLRPPAIMSETANGAVVTSREFWRYANSINSNEFCEVRDYVYNMVRDGERYRVRSVQSRLVRTGCGGA